MYWFKFWGPAQFDRNVRAVFGDFNEHNLQRLSEFYQRARIKAVIDGYHDRPIYTFDFFGNKTPRCYTKAKIMDMVGFEQGGGTDSE